MKVFEINEKMFVAVGVCASPTPVSWSKNAIRHLLGFTILSLMCMACVSCLFFIVEFATINIEDTLSAVFPISAHLTMVVAFLTTYMKREKLKFIFREFQNTYDKCEFRRYIIYLLID